MFEQIQIWGFLAGLGLFLLGMLMLEQGLKGLASKSLKTFLRNRTKSPIRGVITGTVTTAFLQSSSLVGLIVLAFVGAGILELRNALGIIFGSNLGTTLTGWVVTAIGFKLDLVRFAQPMLAFGALGTVFLKKDSKLFFYSNLLLGLGLLLMGLGEMKDASNSVAQNVDVEIFRGYSPFVYLLAGALFTAVIQSSSATMMIVLTALNAAIIDLHAAAAIIVGADLGTTSTVLLGALKGTVDKRRVALSHFYFNFITDVLAFLSLPLLIYFVTEIINIKDPLYSLVAFHSLFNLVGLLIFIPLVDRVITLLKWSVKDDEEKHICEHIRRVPADVTEAAIEAVYRDLVEIIKWVAVLNLHCLKINKEDVFHQLTIDMESSLSYEDSYALLKRAEGEAVSYTYLIQKDARDEDDIREITELNHAIRNIVYSAKFMKDIRHNLMEFRHSSSSHMAQAHTHFQTGIKLIYRKCDSLIINKNPELAIEHLVGINREIRTRYEELIQEIYAVSGEDKIDDHETSSLLNVNRSVYLSNSALIEAVRVLLRLGDEQITNAELLSA